MAIVNLVKINDRSGILLSDEEFWRQGRRRTLSLDNLQSLLPDNFRKTTPIEAVIGIVGDPSITYDAVLRTQKRIKSVTENPKKEGFDQPPQTLKAIADIAVEEIDKLIRKRIDDQLKFAYGFDLKDLNRGFFEDKGEKVDISQDEIRSDALKWIKSDSAPPRVKRLLSVSAIIAGIDEQNGFHWYEWEADSGNLFLGSGYFETIGKGSDGANLAFIDIFRQWELPRRRKGMKTTEAILALLESMEAALRFNHEVGGYPSLMIIDGNETTTTKRLQEITGHRTKLALEIVTAYIHDYLDKAEVLKMVKNLIIDGKDHESIENQMFEAAHDKSALEHFLRGYKSSLSTPRKGASS